ncbi:Carbamoyl-phosphate synthase L chain ATP- binding protein [Haliangium ochraceum DSM 14365]|uniref:Carbamoyl-phosphate synthase L chain ATP-binding protein n=2 Tax=Haliangium ochraceum TaxID=80816 RepID=D0LGS3_HALO1|nr:Carbamoyl-phosphate synthase L chain ATP- binding protein [Haliangium ochraceum DSM 14365]
MTMKFSFQRIAIANRGEPARRFLTAVRELEGEHAHGLRTIALYTEPDRRAMFVRDADESLCIGDATYVDPRDGQRKSSYLDYDRLERALRETRAEAVWVGWGFVSEHAAFADLCQRMGVVFIGPSGDVMRKLGDKIRSKQIAEEAQVPVAPWSNGPVATLEDARAHAERIGYPLMVKATAGGGGRGIRKVVSAEALDEAFESARTEALRGFGDDTVFLERMVTGARHVEVQLVADQHGTTWALGVRDCSIQRRNQKVLEETPSPALSEQQDRELRAAAVRLGQAVGYQNAGTVEFLYDEANQRFSFMEVNARLQVEHPITELVTGADLVKLQLHVAAGGELAAEPPPSRGHAIEVRLNAEDPDSGFAPAPGHIEIFRLPTGSGLRIDTGVEAGDEVPETFDSMIAKFMAYGRTRAEALGKLQRALTEAAVVIRGGMSNKGFLLELLRHPDVRSGAFDVAWLDGLVAAGRHVSRQHLEVALVYGAIAAYEQQSALDRLRFFQSASRGRPELSEDIGHPVELGYQSQRFRFFVRRLGTQHYQVIVDGHTLWVAVASHSALEKRIGIAGTSYRVLAAAEELYSLIEVDGVPHRVSHDSAGVVRASAPAVVVSVHVEAGDEVATGDRLAVLEAMKTEMPLLAKFPGRVREVLVQENIQVPAGTPLLILDPLDEEDAAAEAAPVQSVDFAPLAEPLPGEQPEGDDYASEAALGLAPQNAAGRPIMPNRAMQSLHQLLRGFDADAGDLQRIVASHGVLCADATPDDPVLWRAEGLLLRIYADLLSLFRRHHEDTGAPELVRLSTAEYLITYLRDIQARGEGLPELFLARLRQALSHYSVTSLEPTPELEEAIFRIFKANFRIGEQTAPILGVLQRKLEHVEAVRPLADDSFRELLDRLVAVTQGRFPAINDLARELRYALYERPLLEQARSRLYAEVDEHLTHLTQSPECEDRAARVEALISFPQPVNSFFARRLPELPPEQHREAEGLMLEVFARRYYHARGIERLRCQDHEGQQFVIGEYELDGTAISVVACHAQHAELAEAAQRAAKLVAELPAEHDVIIDFYLSADTVPENGEAEAEATAVRRILEATPFTRRIRRMTTATTPRQGGLGRTPVPHFTFRPVADSDGEASDDSARFRRFQEETRVRGLHPMMAKRLRLWRLDGFHIERLPSVEDVYLFRATARDNPQDERMLALAEVRDLTEVRDDAGHVVSLPLLERMFMEAIDAIRRAQARRPSHRRLHWNRVHLFVWPPLVLTADEFSTIVHRLAPTTEGLGIERVLIDARVPDAAGKLVHKCVDISNPDGQGMATRFREPPTTPMQPHDPYTQKVVRLRQRGLLYPYELLSMLAPAPGTVQTEFPHGHFHEYELAEDGEHLEPVSRPPGRNTANVVVGVVQNHTPKHPEGMRRVVVLGDPSKGMGALAEPECRRINAALALARELSIPLEWYALSAGAKIAMDSGTENMDWISLVLRRLIEFTQDGGEVNIVVTGINVGAQPYWNAEATMLMHTRGVLIMLEDAAMVLTGKRALDYSGGVSAEDNAGIGGYHRIMGPNGQAQYYARDVSEACHILLRHYEHTYVAPGERFPRPAPTTDDAARDVCEAPHAEGLSFQRVGEVLSNATNPGRKKAFDIRSIMRAATDQDHAPLERWMGMRDAESAVVWDAHIGGYPVCLLGVESQPLARFGFVPADGPAQWTAGTLFPMASKKMARAINAASANRPVVVLANLSGFDGSPESMRTWQLEYGAEIGRAVVNFRGPLVFCVVSRYHGGAFVVFSNRLNEHMEVAALEGTQASVIGGAPAAAVVFAREVDKRTGKDPRVVEISEALERASGAEKVRLRARLDEVRKQVHAEKLGAVASEFDRIHSVQRAQEVGSVHHIVAPERLRAYLIEAIERGMERTLASEGALASERGEDAPA